MRLYSYIVLRDYGFAPNPFHGYCTLATCKPQVRRTASVGDWILGTGSAQRGLAGHAVYAMRVDETLTFDEYWNDPRFASKRPNLRGSRKHQFGDNIYRRDEHGEWRQLPSHHSMHDGSRNVRNVGTDTRVDRVLVSRHFVYWGGDAPVIPQRFRDQELCKRGVGHKCRFSDGLVRAVVEWIECHDSAGRIGRPERWDP